MTRRSECSHDYNTDRCFSSYKFMEECVVQGKVSIAATTTFNITALSL